LQKPFSTVKRKRTIRERFSSALFFQHRPKLGKKARKITELMAKRPLHLEIIQQKMVRSMIELTD